MKVLVSWLRELVAVSASPEEIARTMSVRGFAVEGIEGSGEDAVLDFEVTANRPDAMSMLGMAREVATAYGVELRSAGGRSEDRPLQGSGAGAGLQTGPHESGAGADLQTGLRESGAGAGPQAGPHESGAGAGLQTGPRESGVGAGLQTGPRESGVGAGLQTGPRERELAVIIEDAELCPRYVGAAADVTVAPSPAWMQQRLQAAGVRPISNIVDITNYVLLELGQPMHAFDAAKIARSEIRVRTARAGETLKTLDGQMRTLTPDMLVIADAERAAAVAGVMGGADSEVTSGTTAIVLESAYFNPLSVRRTSKKLGLKTEASMRFERGADPNLPARAMARALELLELTGAGNGRGTIVDEYPDRRQPAVLRLRRPRIAGLLGATIPDADVERILTSLGFELTPGGEGWSVTVPTRRVDVQREEDLVEEVARHYGLDRLPTTFPALMAAPPASDPRIARARHLRSVMTAAGFFEAVTFGFIGEGVAAPFAAAGDLVPIANPLSENFAVLRPSALPGLIDAVVHNRRREQRDVRVFEIGNRFSRSAGERRALACAWIGAAGGDHWSGGHRDVDFFDMTGVVSRIGEAMRIETRTEPHQESWLAPGRTAAILTNGTRIGVVGQLAPAIAEQHGLAGTDPLYVAEIDLDAAEQMSRATLAVEPLPRYPSVARDISVLVDETLASAQVRATIREAAPATLVRVREFDRYQGKGIPEGKVSLSVRLTFRSVDRTLTDAEVQSGMDAVLAALQQRHAAVQR